MSLRNRLQSADTSTSYGPDRWLPYRVREIVFRVALYSSAVFIAFIMAFPVYWMAQNSFKTRAAILEGVSFLPTTATFTLSRYEILFTERVGRYILNSIIVTSGTVVTVVVLSLIAGYSLARFRYSGKVHFARFLLFGYMFSPIVVALPLFLIWKSLGLLNNPLGAILALSATAMPFGVWIMWKYLLTIPSAMEESAWIDGASRVRGFVDIVLPQTKPALIAVALFAFAVAWNDFTFARILLPAKEATTFPPGILALVRQEYSIPWGDVAAAGFFMAVPPLLFAYFLQSYLLKGFEIRQL